MMTPEIVSVLGMLFSGISMIVVAKIQTDGNKQKKIDDKREERRQKESRLSMQMMEASIELADVNAVALQNGKLNGNVEAARNKAKNALEEYRAFLADVTSEVI
jgi:hypothetical protein